MRNITPALVTVIAAAADAQPTDPIASFFGFEPHRIVVVGPGCGPAITADFNGDGRPDLAVVDNARSRIEIFYLRDKPRTPEEQQRAARANELPPNEWYDSERVPVSHAIGALLATDANADGKVDIIYAGSEPQELVVLAQETPSKFVVHSRRRVRGLTARPAAMILADVVGTPTAELVVIVEGAVSIVRIDPRGVLSEPEALGGPGNYAAVFAEDFNGDALQDLLAVAPDALAPIRLWVQKQDPSHQDRKVGLLAGEKPFEMPGLAEVQPVRFPGRQAASIGVIERASRRIIFYDFIERSGTTSLGEVQTEVFSYPGPAAKDRAVVTGDLDGDGLSDVLAADPKGNQVLVFRQDREDGLGAATPSPTFKNPTMLAMGGWAGQRAALFVMSEDEKAVGVSSFNPGQRRFEFPRPITLATPGAGPVAMRHVVIGETPTLVVVVRDRRTMTLELHRAAPGSDPSATTATSILLEGVEKPPKNILEFDADRDGHSDLLLLTPNEPLILVRSDAKGSGSPEPSQVLTSKQMGQFGLVQAAGPENTTNMDIDGDGFEELLVADQNFVRACAYDPVRGWRVVEQVNVRDAGAKLGAIAAFEIDGAPAIVAADVANRQLLVFRRGPSGWEPLASTRLLGFTATSVTSGRFAGDERGTLACLADDGFAVIRLGGGGASLSAFASYRSDVEGRREHEMEVGDVNADGFTDAVVLDAGQQMLQVFTFSRTRKLHLATEFEVFESRLFSGGQSRQLEPSAAIVRDLTGDGLDDIGLVVHDRIIIYPQMRAR